MQATAPFFQTAPDESGAGLSELGSSDVLCTGIPRAVDGRLYCEALEMIPSVSPRPCGQ